MEYSAVILAGGRSRRMGEKKLALTLGDKSFLDILTDRLHDAGIVDLMISGYECSGNGLRYVPDVHPGKGPLSGIHACLEASVNPYVLFLTEDAPLVPVTFLKDMMASYRNIINDMNEPFVMVSSYGGYEQPFPGIYPVSISDLCEQKILEDRLSVRSILDTTAHSHTGFSGDEILIRGCNTPEEYEKLKSMYSDIVRG